MAVSEIFEDGVFARGEGHRFTGARGGAGAGINDDVAKREVGTGLPRCAADQSADAVKSERLSRLQAAIDRQQAVFNARCRGRRFDVLFEKPGRHPGQIVGRSPYLQPVQVMGPSTMIGDIAAVTITEISANSLFGALAQTPNDAEPVLVEG